MVWAVGKGLHLKNSLQKIWLLTFRSGETEIVTEYIFVNDKYRISAKDVKVISDEGIVSQHSLLLMDMGLKKKVRRKLKFGKK